MAVKKGIKTQDEQEKEIRQEIKMSVDERQKIAKKTDVLLAKAISES
jgi:hypothetical protein